MNEDKLWLENYLTNYKTVLFSDISTELVAIKNLWIQTKNKGGKIIFAGNGGSAAMASHIAVDLTKNGKLRAINFNEADLITCFANDYGYENWVARAIEHYYDSNDSIVLISSSGQSKNILNAAKYAKKMNLPVVTFSGFKSDNPLRQLGDINIWIDSQAYNIIEMSHHIWLLAIVDLIIGNAEYPA